MGFAGKLRVCAQPIGPRRSGNPEESVKEPLMMKRCMNVQMPTVLLAAVLMVGTVGAQQAAIAPSRSAQVPQSLGGGQLPPVDKYVVGTAKPPQVPGSEPIDMTLEQAIQIALDHNLSLEVAKLNPQIQDYALEGARAVFVPQITASYNYNNSSKPSTNTTEGVLTNITTTNQYNSGVSQSLPWYGGSYAVNFNNSSVNSNNKTLTRNPSYNSSLQFTYTQPLLQGFSTDNNRTNIQTNQIQREITDIQLLTTIENTKATVRSSYWALKAAIEKIEISRRAEALAQQLYDNDKTQVTIGTMAEIDTAQPEAALAQAQGATLAAEIAWQQADLAFKQLLVAGPDDDLLKKTINPVDIPTVGPEPNLNITGAVQQALVDRTDIQQAVKGLEQTDLSFKLTQNQTRPQLNLLGGFTNAGLGGPTAANLASGYGDAFTSVVQFSQPTWVIGSTFTYQLGMQANKAALARAQLSYDQQKANLKVTQLGVVADVTGAGLNVQNTYKQYLAGQKARVAQEAATNAEQTKFTVGLSNNFNVVTQQNNLTSARLSELNALINYINAVADYDRKQRIGGTGSTASVGGSTGGTSGGSTTGSTGGSTGGSGSGSTGGSSAGAGSGS
jgi:outer membrane protein